MCVYVLNKVSGRKISIESQSTLYESNIQDQIGKTFLSLIASNRELFHTDMLSTWQTKMLLVVSSRKAPTSQTATGIILPTSKIINLKHIFFNKPYQFPSPFEAKEAQKKNSSHHNNKSNSKL